MYLKQLQLLKLATLGKYPGYLLEGMACPGGCVAGAGTMQAIKKSQTSVGLYAKQSTHKTSSETEYIKELDKLDRKSTRLNSSH